MRRAPGPGAAPPPAPAASPTPNGAPGSAPAPAAAIADVAFDAPIDHPFSYLVPDGWTVAPGQRVSAPLRGALRPALVVAVRAGQPSGLKPLAGLLDDAPVLEPAALALVDWISAESLSSRGSTALSLLPPPAPTSRRARGGRTASAEEDGAPRPQAPPAPATPGLRRADARPRLLVGPGRERRLLDLVRDSGEAALVLTPDVEAAARWAARLGKLAPVARLDSGVSDAERARGWARLRAGEVRLAVGTRSALLAPLSPGALVAVVDEHEAAHRPPGPPRIHAREVVLERARRDGLCAVLTSATPSAEIWWQADQGRVEREAPAAAAWPAVSVAETRGIAPREAITPPLARAIREALAARRRVFLAVSRLTSALGCDECGAILRCERCAIALAYSPAARALACRLCASSARPPDTCAGCGGHRLAPFGWGAERVEQAVRRRFPSARITRYDPEAMRGRRAEAQRAAAATADIVIGTRGALRLFGPGSLGVAGFVSPDQLLGLPDFRAAERLFSLVGAAAERVRADGCVVIQSRSPEHYAIAAATAGDLAAFYAAELRFREELGYPPFRRLAVVSASSRDPGTLEHLARSVADALRGSRALTAYPPAADRRGRTIRIVVKGGERLPRDLAEALGDLLRGARSRGRGIIDVEVDPVEWPS